MKKIAILKDIFLVINHIYLFIYQSSQLGP